MHPSYLNSVRLLLEAAPAIFRHPHFALKGGTAINLFLRDLPRLSVDLDVVFTDHRMTRDEALALISSSLEEIRADLEGAGLRCDAGTLDGGEVKLFVEKAATRVKVEVNHVSRGTVLPVESRPLGETAQDTFFSDLEIPILHPDELYGGKLVAAMDRQHPRDLFDVFGLHDSGGLTPDMIECFVCYLAGHNRPVHEVLFARELPLGPAYGSEFAGMTRQVVPLEQLEETRRRLFAEIPASLTDNQRSFLTGLVKVDPDWSLMSCDHLRDLPAIRWKLENLSRLKQSNPDKFTRQATELEERLSK